VMADEAARKGRTAGGQNNPNAPVRTTMRFYPGGMGGMGQSAADNVRDKGSTMDEWQNARNARAMDDSGSNPDDPDGSRLSQQLRGVGQPLQKPTEFWKNRFEDLLKDPSATLFGKSAPSAEFPENFEKKEDIGDNKKPGGGVRVCVCACVRVCVRVCVFVHTRVVD